MSVKIYNGLSHRFANSYIAASKIKEVIEPIFMVEVRKLAKEIATSASMRGYLNTYCEAKIPEGVELHEYSSMYYAFKHIRWAQQQSIFQVYDVGYRVDLYQNSNVLVFSGNANTYYKALIDSGVVDEWGYWDNADEPEDVSPEEWWERQLSWSPDILGQPLSFESPTTSEPH